MIEWIIGGGLGLLVSFAVVVGQRSAQEQAWKTIAQERRRLHEARRALDELRDDLVEEGIRLQEWESRLVLLTERTIRQDGS